MSNKTSLANYDNIKSIIKSFLLTFKNGISIRDFQKRYEEDILEKIPYKELGYCDPEQFFLSMPDAVDVRYSRDGVMILEARCDSSNAHLKSLIDQQKRNSKPLTRNKRFGQNLSPWITQNHSSRKSQNQRPWTSQNHRPGRSQNFRNPHCFKPPRMQIPEWKVDQSEKKKIFPAEVKDRLVILITKYSFGLESEELLKAYYHEYKDLAFQNDLSYKDYGFKNCEELFLSLLDIFTTEKLHTRLLFYPIISSTNNVIQKEDKELESNKVIGENFSYVSIENFVDDDDPFLHVSIGEVYSPYNFSIIVDGSSLDELMEEIQEFYVADILKDWKLGNEHIVLNHPVIILYEDAYTRAAITAFKEFDMVEVLCVDYGTTAVVSKSVLLYLHKNFFILPAQAVSAKLYGIKPIRGIHWENSRSISERFLQLVRDKVSLFADIKELEPHFKKLSVTIIDTEDEYEDVCINSVLVSEGYAQSSIIGKKPNLETINRQNSDNLEENFDDSPEASNTDIDESSVCQNGTKQAHKQYTDRSQQNGDETVLSYINKENSHNCNNVDINNREINESKSCVDKWLQHLPPSSILSTQVSSCEGFTIDAIMHIDAACQSIYDKRSMLLQQLKDDVNNDADAHALIVLNTCARALKNVKKVLEDVEN